MNAQDKSLNAQAIVSKVSHYARTHLYPGYRSISSVAAIITVDNDTQYLEQTLRSVLEQTCVPSHIIVASCDTPESAYNAHNEDSVAKSKTKSNSKTDKASKTHKTSQSIPVPQAPSALQNRYNSSIRVAADIQVQCIHIDSAHSFGEAINATLRALPQLEQTHGLWLLHDDSYPNDATYLETMLEVWQNTPSVAVLGAKHIDARTGRLQQVGYYATSHHSVTSLVVAGELDQEQYDTRSDVFAVSLAGAVVNTRIWYSLGGASSALYTAGQSADYCRRVCRSGGRVVVVPQAVLRHYRARVYQLRSLQGYALLQASSDFEKSDTEKSDTEKTLVTHNSSVAQSTASIPNIAYRIVDDARAQYYFTDIAKRRWFLAWLWLLISSIGRTLGLLAQKNMVAAASKFTLPWRMLLWLPQGTMARRKVRDQANIPLHSLDTLLAHRDQIKLYKERKVAFEQAMRGRMLNQLELAHIRSRKRRRALWAALMSGIVLACTIWLVPDAWHALITNSGITTVALPPTAATFGQLIHAAFSPIAYADGLGMAYPPTPFFVILTIVSLCTGGHVASAVALIIIAGPSCAALSMWALAGTFTRSNAVRVSSGFAWAAFVVASGILAYGNIPMLVLATFLPAGIAFVYRAVGMYRTEEIVTPTASIQSAACASLCLAACVACAPQLVLVMIPLFVVFILAVRSHRVMLFLMPLPAAVLLAPTLFNVVRHLGQGALRQLFASVLIPVAHMQGVSAPVSITALLAHLFGIDTYSQAFASGASVESLGWFGALVDSKQAVTMQHVVLFWGIAALIAVLSLSILACVTLAIPSLLRASRLMFGIAVMGGMLACIAVRVAIDQQPEHIAGDVLPGLMMMVMGFLCGAAMLAGRAAKPFEPLVDRSVGRRALSVQRKGVQRQVMNIGRTVLVLAIVSVCLVWGYVGYQRTSYEHPVTATQSLPSIAQDYVYAQDNHRILAVSADSDAHINMSIMRTAQGDLIDRNAAYEVSQATGRTDPLQRSVQQAVATLLITSDEQAIATIAQTGIGGIYIPQPSDGANSSLVAHIIATSGTSVVVDNSQGVFIRLSQVPADSGVDLHRYTSLAVGAWQQVWIWSLAITMLIYCIVAFPRIRR
ncbi:membrane protein [Galliscardovia ingluviei]|uniref:Membrane protein n=1 Tax=Galliscardovia ingluviei TaxID=1769422 RepID=A0A8J3EYA0_9BIFI|nr:hypothetical protein [Galliscardovia ingluviei]GGI13654.1 membrane protein [Galliscardovia ingluviei]